MTQNHTNQQKIQNNQNNELVSEQKSIPGVEEVNEADLDAISGGILKWCSETKKWVDVGDYHLMPNPRPRSMGT
ncbi:hypothetical protein BZZ01_09300 [Nostocales cyanobacterium HT-58-2]|nr:hypothetical protein BZZ01_09300 [Nostocales cyanobacterium HT-58-2]